MTDNELFGISEQLDDTISRRATLDALTEQADEMSRWCERYQEQRKGVLTARNIIKDLPSAQHWISCEERLPYAEYGESDTVLTTCGYRDVEDTSVRWIRLLYFNGSNWCYPTGETYEAKVYAWCPLPEPWKGERDG